MAASLGFRSFSGRAEELERDQPFGPLAQALSLSPSSQDPARAAVGDLLTRRSVASATTPFSPAADLRARLVDDIIDLLERESTAGPVALLLDDLQWADDATLLALPELGRRLFDKPVLIAGAYRPLPRTPALRLLFDALPAGTVDHLVLGPLDPPSVEALAIQLTGDRPGASLLRQADGAAGNPFFLQELFAALVDDGLVEIRDGRAEVRTAALPPSLRTTVIRRLGFLPEPSLRVLRWASVLGTSFVVADLAAVLAASIDETVEALEPALRAQVVVDAGRRLAFRHDLVHEAIYADTPEAIRVGFHLHVGRVLAAAGAEALHVAPHFARGAQGHELEAASWLRRAADDVALRSPATAVGLLERALELTAPRDAVRSELLLELVKTLLWSGRWDDAEDLARRVLENDQGAAIDGTLRYVMARALVYRGRTADSVREVDQALGYAIPDRDRARLLADLSMRLPLLGDLGGGRLAAEEALLLATDGDDKLAASTARSGLALIAVLGGDPMEGARVARAALPRGEGSIAETVELVQPYFFYSIALIDADRLDEAGQVLGRLRRRTEEMGMTWALGLSERLLALLHFLTGDWADALAEAETGIALCEETGTRVWSLVVDAVLVRIASHQGDADRAAQAVMAGERLVAETGLAHLGLERWFLAQALVQEAAGDSDGAYVTLNEAWRTAESRGLVAGTRELGPDLVRLAVARGERSVAEMATRAVESAATRAATPSYEGAALRCRGLLADDPALLARAADAYRRAGRLLELGAVCEDGGLIHGAHGRLDEARGLLEEALGHYGRLGAARDAARAEQHLRALGVRRGARGPRQRPTVGWESLTPTELDVARLAAKGLTNRQIGARMFISSRTVATHVSHVFGKVGLSSRVELAAVMARGIGEAH